MLRVVLAFARPTVTYHLAPALVAAAYPALRWAGRRAPLRSALFGTAAAAAVVVATALVLDVAGVLRGPALVGGDALGEALIAAAAGAGIGFVLARSRRP